jgi:transposase
MKVLTRPAPRAQSAPIEFVPKRELDEAQREIERLRKENEQLERDREQLQRDHERLQREREQLDRDRKQLERENERLQRELDAALRASKRQAAPHSRGTPKATPKRPGRKPGAHYGQPACRPIPAHVDEQITVPCPARCPHCGGDVEPERCAPQYQEDIVRRTVVRRFDITIGRCRQCQRPVQGRHPLQTSDAVGVGRVQVGPQALALAAILTKRMGLSLGHTRQALAAGFELAVSRGGLARALARLAERAAPTYAGLRAAVRQSPVVGLDETGWKVGGRLQWLHVAVTAQVVVYAIQPGRGYAQAVALVGVRYAGVLVHDGWKPYYRFEAAQHQSCLAHLLRRCRDLTLAAATAAARAFPRAVTALLRASLALRDRHAQGTVSGHGLRVATGRLEAHLARLLARPRRTPAHRRLARHLAHERPALFTFLRQPGLPATNHATERAVRGMVIARKVWGGNRTWAGARTHHILASVVATCVLQGQCVFTRLVALQRAPRPVVLDLIPPPQTHPATGPPG